MLCQSDISKTTYVYKLGLTKKKKIGLKQKWYLTITPCFHSFQTCFV